jgi:hypothetical protein
VSVTVQTGDLIVVDAMSENNDTSFSISGGSLTWTKQIEVNQSGRADNVIWTATATSSTTFNVSVDNTGTTRQFGVTAQVWRNHGGTGAVGSATSSSGAPALPFTTAQDNSALAVFNADWLATNGSGRVWRTVNVAATETLYTNPGQFAAYAAYHTDAGTAGSVTVGLSAPTGQRYSLTVLEILGAVGQPTGIPSALAFGTPTVTYGPVTLSPTGIASKVAFGTPVLATSALMPTGIESGLAFGTPVATVDTWRQIIERDWFQAAVNAHQRTIGYRAVMIDSKDREVTDVPVSGGSVDCDGDAAERWSCSITVVGKEWVPNSPKHVLDPRAGYRLRLYWRILIGSGWVEIPIGTFNLENPSITDNGPMPVITMKGRDVLSVIRDAGYGSEVVSVGGLTVPDALTRIFQRLVPDATIKIESSSTITLPDVYELSANDPLQDITTIAAQAGLLVFSDPEGIIVCAPAPEPNTPKADWQEGVDCPVTDLARDITTSAMKNSITVVSTNPEVDPPISATVEDDDPSSPTWVEGPFRRRRLTVRDDSVADVAGAEGLARSLLEGRKRPSESVKVTVPGRGDLIIRDQILLRRENVSVSNPYRVLKWSLPITAANEAPPVMSVTMMDRMVL